jgi:O-antigen ligase
VQNLPPAYLDGDVTSSHPGLARPSVSIVGPLVFVYVASAILLAERPTTSSIAVVLGFALALVYALHLIHKDAIFVFPAPLSFFLAFICFCTFQMLWAPGSVERLFTLYQLLILAIVVVNYCVSSIGIKAIEYGFYIGLSGTFLYNIFGNEIASEGRLASTLGNTNTYSLALTIGIAVAARRVLLSSASSTHNRIRNIVLLLFIAICGYTVVYTTASRKGMIITLGVITALTLYWIIMQELQRRILYSVTIVVVFGIIAYYLYRAPEVLRFTDVSNYLSGQHVADTGLIGRFTVMKAGIGLWLERPLSGWGLDQFQKISGFSYYTHNNYIELLANNGIIGLLLYLMIYVSVFVSLVRTLRLCGDRVIAAEMFWGMVLLTALLLSDMTGVGYLGKLNWLALSTAVGVSTRARHVIMHRRLGLPVGGCGGVSIHGA